MTTFTTLSASLIVSLASLGAAPVEAPDTEMPEPVLMAGATAPVPKLALQIGSRLGDEDDSQTVSERREQARRDLVSRTFLHGFRLGGMYIHNHDMVVVGENETLRTAYMFLIGYEFFYRIEGGDWLNVLLVANVMIGGLEQSLFIPSANFLIGFEIDNQFQIGVGPNLTPPHGQSVHPTTRQPIEREKVAHVSIAVGWTPLVGAFYVPIHFFFIPDMDNEHRMGMTVGVTW